MRNWDVFVSHSHADEIVAAELSSALTAAGLRVFRAVGAIATFTSISERVLDELRSSRVLLACYSADYPRRSACQFEFATAYLAGQAEGDPLSRVMAINLEPDFEHVEPRDLRDVLLPTISSGRPLSSVVQAIVDRVSTIDGVIGDAATMPTHWLSRPTHPPTSFVGRWRELWWLHSALQPQTGPLTSPPGTPIAVIHGPGGIGKTALAAEYVRRFGSAFPGGVLWRTASMDPTSPPRPDRLWVIDDVEGEPKKVIDLLPSDPRTPCLLLTRDPRLARLGNPLALSDLTIEDSAQLIATRVGGHNVNTITAIIEATAGSPELRARVAESVEDIGVDPSLNRLHQLSDELLNPIREWLAPELRAAGHTEWDVLRVLAAAAPAAVPILRVADILAAVAGTDRVTEIVPVQQAVTRLVSRGVIPGTATAIELCLPRATVLALRGLDTSPHRTELMRAETIRVLTSESAAPTHEPTYRRYSYSDEEQRAAHRIQTELLNRISGRPLADNECSLREALDSLHALIGVVRTTHGAVHPAALHTGPDATSLDNLVNRLINGVLRPRLTYWHVELGAHEDLRPSNVSRIDHERSWVHHKDLRDTLLTIHRQSLEIARQLSSITGREIPPELLSND